MLADVLARLPFNQRCAIVLHDMGEGRLTEHALEQPGGPAWQTAGDMFVSLLATLPPEAAADPATWERFTTALALETGVDPRRITADSPLLLPDKGFGGHLKEALLFTALLWLAMLLGAVVF